MKYNEIYCYESHGTINMDGMVSTFGLGEGVWSKENKKHSVKYTRVPQSEEIDRMVREMAKTEVLKIYDDIWLNAKKYNLASDDVLDALENMAKQRINDLA